MKGMNKIIAIAMAAVLALAGSAFAAEEPEADPGIVTGGSSHTLQKRSYYDGSGTLLWYYIFGYNENGQMINATSYDVYGNETGHVDFGYRDDGQELNNCYAGNTGALKEIKYEYDGSGRLVKEYELDALGQPNGDYSSYEYFDRDGGGYYRRETNYYGNDNNVEGSLVEEVDENDKAVKQYDFDEDGTLNCWYEYERAMDGTLLASRQYLYDNFGNIIPGGITLYEYDSEGNCTCRHYYSDGSLSRTYIEEWL